ncbi:hypothetical protein ACVIRO_001286 [Rhizobium ruizarguesonis]
MKVKCINAVGYEPYLTLGNVYTAEISAHDADFYTVAVGGGRTCEAFTKRFEVLPSVPVNTPCTHPPKPLQSLLTLDIPPNAKRVTVHYSEGRAVRWNWECAE